MFVSFMVMPSYYESFGLVSLEALACGLPVVATPVGVMDTVIREGLNGPLVANGDATLLAKAIDRVASRSAARSVAAIRQTVQEFAWPHIASAMIGEYGEVLSLGNLMAGQSAPEKLTCPGSGPPTNSPR